MRFFRYLLMFIGHLWALPHSLVGFLLAVTVYWPKSIRFRNGIIEIVVYKDHLIPAGLDRTGDGDYDDPEDFRTGGQTHGGFHFYADEANRDSRRTNQHERWHTVQTMLLGGVLYPVLYGLSVLIGLIRGKGVTQAYWDCWFERWARARETTLPWVMR